MPTEQQLIGALKKADAAGDYEAAKRFAELIKEQRAQAEKPQEPDKHTMTEGVINSAGQGLTMGFADEIQAGILATIGTNLPASMGGLPDHVSLSEAYEGIRNEIRGRNKQFSDENPKTALAAEIGGAVLSGGVGATKMGALKAGNAISGTGKAVDVANKAVKVAKVAGVAGVEGAVYGAGSSDADVGDSDFYDDVVSGFKTSAAVGVAGQGVVKVAQHFMNNKAAKKLVEQVTPEIKTLKKKAGAIYREIEDSGAQLKPAAYDKLVDKISNTLSSEGYRPAQNAGIKAALADMASESGQSVELRTVDSFRKAFRDKAGEIGSNDSRLAGLAIDQIDDFLEKANAGMIRVDADSALKPKDITAKYKDARELWKKAKKSELIQELFTSSEVQASGVENGLRIKMRQIFANQKKRNLFTKEEQRAIKAVANGTPVQNVIKNLGKFGLDGGHQGQSLMPALGAVIGTSATAGNPLGGVAVLAAGSGLKRMSNNMTAANAKAVEQMVRNGKDAHKLARAYLSSVPAKERSAKEFAGLLANYSGGEVQALAKRTKNDLIKEAIGIYGTATSAARIDDE